MQLDRRVGVVIRPGDLGLSGPSRGVSLASSLAWLVSGQPLDPIKFRAMSLASRRRQSYLGRRFITKTAKAMATTAPRHTRPNRGVKTSASCSIDPYMDRTLPGCRPAAQPRREGRHQSILDIVTEYYDDASHHAPAERTISPANHDERVSGWLRSTPTTHARRTCRSPTISVDRSRTERCGRAIGP